VSEHMLNVALRAAGRLGTRGLPLAVRAALIQDAFEQVWDEGQPSPKAAAMETNPDASPSGTFVPGLWCHSCGLHRVTTAMELCPCCTDDQRRAS